MKKYVLLGVGLMLSANFSTPQTSCSRVCNWTCDCERYCPDDYARCVDACECKEVSHTHLSVRPLFQTASPERESLFHDRAEAALDGKHSAFQFTVIGSKTTRPEKIATYFGPSCKCEWIVRECDLELGDSGIVPPDIIANHLNIQTKGKNFESIIRLAPSQSVFGVGLEWKKVFAQNDEGRGFWFSGSTALMRINNKMNLFECVKNHGGGPLNDNYVGTVTEAFRQESWQCGRIDCGCEEPKTTFADLDLQFGYECFESDGAYMDSYVGAILPTGNRVCSKRLFAPVIGNGRHIGLQFGNIWGLRISENVEKEREMWVQFHFNGHYLFPECERRLLDKKCKPWSRYMRVYRNKEQAQEALNLFIQGNNSGNSDLVEQAKALHTPGVNVFCRDVNVRPGFIRTINTTYFLSCRNWVGELGYNFYCRPEECIDLACGCCEKPAFISLDNQPGSVDNGLTISQKFNNANASLEQARDICGSLGAVCEDGTGCVCQTLIGLYDKNSVSDCDLDLRSAANPATITHTLYGSVGYRWDDRDNPIFAGIGGSYELSGDNAGIDRWVAWAKTGISW